MAKLSASIRRATKQGNLAQAVVIDVLGNRASVRLSGKGARYSALPMVGGIAAVGDIVTVDFSGEHPVIIVTNSAVPQVTPAAPLPSRARFGAKKITAPTSGSPSSYSGWGISLTHAGTVTFYEMSAAGLTDAVAASVSGDGLFVPDGEITYNFSLPAGVNMYGMSRYGTKLIGNITLNPGCSLENLTVTGQILYNGTVRVTDLDVSDTTKCIYSGGSSPYLISRMCFFASTSGSGAVVSSGLAYLAFTDFNCGHFDIVAGGTVYVYGCSYSEVSGTVTPLFGDRAAWDVDGDPTKHASDIYSGVSRYHLPTSGSPGMVIRANADGTYSAVPLDLPETTQHAPAHGGSGSDLIVSVSGTEPTETFPGMLWLNT